MTTRGWRPSSRSAARAWLKYASVYQPARIFSTGRSNTSGSRRFSLVRVAILEREARCERRLRNLELVGRRLGCREAVLELVPRLGERLRERMVGVAHHPREDLRRDRDRCHRGEAPRGEPELTRRPRGEEVADRERSEERADEVRAAAFVLLVARLAVLGGADRDVLGAVVGRELGAAQRDGGRSQRCDAGDDLARGRRQALRAARDLRDRCAGDQRRQHARTLERQLRAWKPEV